MCLYTHAHVLIYIWICTPILPLCKHNFHSEIMLFSWFLFYLFNYFLTQSFLIPHSHPRFHSLPPPAPCSPHSTLLLCPPKGDRHAASFHGCLWPGEPHWRQLMVVGEHWWAGREHHRAPQPHTLCTNQNQATGWPKSSEAVLAEKCFLSKKKESPPLINLWWSVQKEKLKTFNRLSSNLDWLHAQSRKACTAQCHVLSYCWERLGAISSPLWVEVGFLCLPQGILWLPMAPDVPL